LGTGPGGRHHRNRAQQAPESAAPVAIDWNEWNAEREAALPRSLRDTGFCSCAATEPCCRADPSYPWTRQISTIDILDEDAVTDSGQEVFNLLEQRGIDDVLVMGVHTNICVLGRPYGIRQLVYLGKKPILCRDLTDSLSIVMNAVTPGARMRSLHTSNVTGVRP
jgi:nicotinamidase-related amidase